MLNSSECHAQKRLVPFFQLSYHSLNNPSFLVAPTGYNGLISGYEYSLTSSYASIFINSESKSWQPKIGRFTYNKSWTVGDC